jgi:hypothetical protein
MTENRAEGLCDETFGAARHDPAFWRDHPMVARAAGDFDSDYGWVELSLRDAPGPASVKATYVAPDATREGPDLYFFGEGDCPVSLFEHVPRLRELRVSIAGPVEGDSRTCWSVGIWLESDR